MENKTEEKKDLEKQLKEIRVENEAKKMAEEVAKQDVVLEARMKADGSLSWNIPRDLMKASFMLKWLETNLDMMIKAKIENGMQKPKDDIRSKLAKLPGIRIFR